MTRKYISVLLLALVLATLAGAAKPVLSQEETAYFLVANPDLVLIGMSDSYVLPLTDPEDIALARVMASGGAGLIVGARITTGSDGINRDMLAPDQPEWSWHVKEFSAFTETAIELCDGTPTYTEGEALNKPEGEVWDICYWNYTVVKEVTDVVPVEGSTWGSIKALFGN